jgi:hypothetical protein
MAPTPAVPEQAAWQAHPGHQVGAMPTPTRPVTSSYAPLPQPSFPARPNASGTMQPVAMARTQPGSPAIPTSLPPAYRAPNPLPELPAGMPMAVTPPVEQAAERQVAFTQSSPPSEPIVPALNKVEVPSEPAREVSSTVKNSTPAEVKPTKAGAPLMRLVNTKRITLNFEVKDVGPSGLASVELWYTQDCREWKKYEAPAQAQAYVIEVDEEGMYGFTLLARSGLGLGKEPPQPGDQPQVWVFVDLTRPTVQLTEVTPAAGRNNQITIAWKASDRNLGRQPITLSYAEKETGPWKVIASHLENTGKHMWQVPQGVARTFFKVEASDLAGNVGQAVSARPVLLDSSTPTVSITNVDSVPGQ